MTPAERLGGNSRGQDLLDVASTFWNDSGMASRNLSAANGIALVALKAFSGRRAAKDSVSEGTSIPIDLLLTGTVGEGRGRRQVSFPIAGKLQVGFQTEFRKRFPANRDYLIGHLLELIPKTKRRDLAAIIAAKCDPAGMLVEPSDKTLEDVAALLAPLVTEETATREPAISFLSNENEEEKT